MKSLPIAALVIATSSLGQTFSYPGFTSIAGLTLNNHAVQSGNLLRVTPSLISQRGTVWYNTPVNVVSGFETTFRFQFSAFSSGGADGLAFVIQFDPRTTAALGNHASAMGYGAFVGVTGVAIANSLAIELDTFQGTFNGVADLSGNEVSVHTNGPLENGQYEGYSIGRANAPINLSDGAAHDVRIRFTGGRLKVFFDAITTATIDVPYDFLAGGTHVLTSTPVPGLALINNAQAYVGFTASTGGSWENHDVLNWSWTSFEDCLSGTAGPGGATAEVVQISGNGGGPARAVALALNQPFSLDILVPPGNPAPSANFILFADFALPAVGGGFALPFGSLCFTPPLPGLTSTAITLCDTFNLGLGPLLPAAPAPFSLPFPGGIPVPIQFVLQGAIETGGGFGITNGIVITVQ